MEYKIAIIGCGIIGKRLGSAFSRSPSTKIVAVCDFDMKKAEQLSSELGGAFYDDYLVMLREVDIDIVYIGIPPSSHAEVTIKCLEAGKHVICEKPMALTATESRKMVEVAETSERVTAINLPLRYTPGLIEMKGQVTEGHLGDLLKGELTFRFPQWPRSWQGVQWLSESYQGGPIREVATHFLFALLELFGKISRVLVFVKHPNPSKYERAATGIISVDKTLQIGFDLLCDSAHEEENTLTLHGSQKSLSLVAWRKLIENYRTDSELVLNEGGVDNSIRLIEEFVKEIETGNGNLVSFQQGHRTQLILDAVLQSKGEWISLDEELS